MSDEKITKAANVTPEKEQQIYAWVAARMGERRECSRGEFDRLVKNMKRAPELGIGHTLAQHYLARYLGFSGMGAYARSHPNLAKLDKAVNGNI